MKAMILAAGRGERLRPLTDRVPKPLIDVGGQPLIGHHLRALAAAGLHDVVINVAYRGGQIQRALGDGRRYGLRIVYSVEQPGALDTGGGIANALPLLGPAPFLVISSDIFSDIDYGALAAARAGAEAHLVLVDNPGHHRRGDFGLSGDRLIDAAPRLTYAGVGVFARHWFAARGEPRFPLSAVLRSAIDADRATGEHHRGRWIDVGRPSALAAARQGLSAA
ncbi:N-acetylmuramate alpha-1-phosphate uridylyltransferase MurU [Salinisphaera sp.]|uniref:N-acetylmuramate alpha-1-phosphate uridylyltransferase MurU n=1 Tax=Salinisphaera sp. TaxID=1914330 RepID=UPI002D768A33|nr:nucleotidyltransferase family protein [Salinisphaera sp.]HET7315594.1 nucleotidyltransferase family protein [Salinisphaera sp.]